MLSVFAREKVTYAVPSATGPAFDAASSSEIAFVAAKDVGRNVHDRARELLDCRRRERERRKRRDRDDQRDPRRQQETLHLRSERRAFIPFAAASE